MLDDDICDDCEADEATELKLTDDDDADEVAATEDAIEFELAVELIELDANEDATLDGPALLELLTTELN